MPARSACSQRVLQREDLVARPDFDTPISEATHFGKTRLH